MILDIIFCYLREKKDIQYIPKNSVVCDIGCGLKAHFLKKFSSFIGYGFGFDKQVRIYKDSSIELKKVDLEKETLPLEEKTIEVVTMLAVAEHLKNFENNLKEIFRILKPGGLLILTTPSPRAKLILEFLAFKLKVINQNDIREHKRYLLPNEIKDLLIRTGFQIENIKIRYFELGFNILVVAKKQ